MTSGGIYFFLALAFVFVVLKLTKVIAWSWGWVLSPLWIGAILLAVLFVLGILAEREKRHK